MTEVLGVGAPVIDRVVHVEDNLLEGLGIVKGGMGLVDLPTLERIERSFHLHSRFVCGGSAANAIKGLAQLGHSCALVGKRGNDRWGREFVKTLSQLHIQSLYLQSDTPTGQILTLVTPDNERSFCSFLGASCELEPHELIPSQFQGVGLTHIEGYTLLAPGVTERALQLAKLAGAEVSFDLASFELVRANRKELERLLGNYVDILFANEEEAEALTGLGPEKACHALQDLCRTVIVFCGADGSWVGQGGKRFFKPAERVAAVDTTGAGDLYASGFLHGYLKQCPPELCAAYGTLAASAVVQVLGAELPSGTWARLKSLYSRLKAV